PAIAAALSDPNQILTVFAPTNEAFAELISALGANSLEDLVAQVGVEALSTILLYHVVDSCAFSNDLRNGQNLTTLQGEKLKVDLRNLSIIDKTDAPANLVPAGLDILTSNGIVHTIDKVLLPDAILENL
ncbi:MAG: fasciclin domain-containing protein, partial [Saprospiraceae bacterium]|nr:fasciclin domain-containing protein [Saprospiraceae bacterium]